MSRTPSGELLAVGIDIVCVDDLKRLLAHPVERLERIFTPHELAAAEGSVAGNPYHAVRLAASFAAKEAVFKALGRGWGQGVQWSEVELSRGRRGEWSVSLEGRAARRLGEMGGNRVDVSVCSSTSHAVAQVLIWRTPAVHIRHCTAHGK